MAQFPDQRLGTRLDMCVHDREKWVESSKEGEREKEMILRARGGSATGHRRRGIETLDK